MVKPLVNIPIIPGPGYFPYDDAFKARIEADEQLQKDEWQLCKHNFRHFCYNWVYIIDMDRNKSLFRFNETQERYHREKTRDDIILKSRKQGISTYKVVECLWRLTFNPYKFGLVLAHELSSTLYLYHMFETAFDGLPDFLKPAVKSRSKENGVVFSQTPFGEELDCTYQIGTAGNYRFGRGATLDFVHLSEYAFYENPSEIMLSVGGARRRDNESEESIESTANGLNDYNTKWKLAASGESVYKPHFFGWTDDPTCVAKPWAGMMENLSDEDKRYFADCTPEQVAFYLTQRDKRSYGADKARQEYPKTPLEAFVISTNTVFDVEVLIRVETEILERQRAMKEKGNNFVEESRESGHILIYKKPKHKWRYVLGADCSKGGKAGNSSCAMILDNSTGEQVAEMFGKWAPEIFAIKLNEIGREYNNALIAVEKERFGTAVLERLVTVHDYPNLFYDHKFDKQTQGYIRELGWTPTIRTKSYVITNLQDCLRNNLITPNSINFLDECKTYVHIANSKRMGAEGGSNLDGSPRSDDRVMAMSVTAYAFIQNPWVPKASEVQAFNSWKQWWHSEEVAKLRARHLQNINPTESEVNRVLAEMATY